MRASKPISYGKEVFPPLHNSRGHGNTLRYIDHQTSSRVKGWNKVQHHSDDSLDLKELHFVYVCKEWKGVCLTVYQKALEQTKRKCDISGSQASTFCTLYSHVHMVWVTQSRFMFKVLKVALHYLPQPETLLTKTCQLHGNLQLFDAAIWGDGASKICFRMVTVEMKPHKFKISIASTSMEPLIGRFWPFKLSIVSRRVILACTAEHFLTLMLIKLHTKQGHFQSIYLSFGQFCHYFQL